MFGLDRLPILPFRGGKARWKDVCHTLEADSSVSVQSMGASTQFWQSKPLAPRIELLVKLSIYVLPRLNMQSATAIERNVAVKFGESMQIQRTIARATDQKLPLSKIMRLFDHAAPGQFDEAMRLFGHLCDIISQSAQGGRVVRGRLLAVSSRMGLTPEQAGQIIKRSGI